MKINMKRKEGTEKSKNNVEKIYGRSWRMKMVNIYIEEVKKKFMEKKCKPWDEHADDEPGNEQTIRKLSEFWIVT